RAGGAPQASRGGPPPGLEHASRAAVEAEHELVRRPVSPGAAAQAVTPPEQELGGASGGRLSKSTLHALAHRGAGERRVRTGYIPRSCNIPIACSCPARATLPGDRPIVTCVIGVRSLVRCATGPPPSHS